MSYVIFRDQNFGPIACRSRHLQPCQLMPQQVAARLTSGFYQQPLHGFKLRPRSTYNCTKHRVTTRLSAPRFPCTNAYLPVFQVCNRTHTTRVEPQSQLATLLAATAADNRPATKQRLTSSRNTVSS